MAKKDPFADFRAERAPTEDAFAKLDEMVKELVAATLRVEKCQAELKDAQADLRQLEEYDVPEYLESIGLESCRTSAGLKVEVVKKIRASIGDRKVQAFRWLIDNGHGGIIKRTVEVAFNTDQGDAAEELLEELRDRNCGAGVRQEMKVEASTLTSFVRRRLEAGEEVPADIFGVFEQKFAKVESDK